MPVCRVDGCGAESKHALCLEHWKLDKDGLLQKCANCDKLIDSGKPLCRSCYRDSKGASTSSNGKSALLSATQIGERIGLKAYGVNRVLAELGWIEKDVEGWVATTQGRKQGATEKQHAQSGVPYVTWPESVVSNHFFREVVTEFTTGPEATAILQSGRDAPSLPAVSKTAARAPESEPKPQESMASIAAREKFRAEYRAADGHFVRSRAELAIDNWLYMNMVIHAFERRVPIDQDILSDFYLPEGKVYIEYWGMESDPAYAARKQQKLKLYRSEGIPLIELTDEHLRNLDDHLPRLLLQHKISVKMR